MQKTPLFWENYVRNKINREFMGVYRFLNDPYPDGPNYYIDRIESNIARLRRELAARADLMLMFSHVARVCSAVVPFAAAVAD